MARPTTPMPDWASTNYFAAPGKPWDNSLSKVEPSDGYISIGHLPEASAPAAYENWYKSLNGAWVRQLVSESDALATRATNLETTRNFVRGGLQARQFYHIENDSGPTVEINDHWTLIAVLPVTLYNGDLLECAWQVRCEHTGIDHQGIQFTGVLSMTQNAPTDTGRYDKYFGLGQIPTPAENLLIFRRQIESCSPSPLPVYWCLWAWKHNADGTLLTSYIKGSVVQYAVGSNIP